MGVVFDFGAFTVGVVFDFGAFTVGVGIGHTLWVPHLGKGKASHPLMKKRLSF